MIKILYCLFWRCCYCTFAPMLLPIFSSFSFHSRTTNRSRIYNFHLKLPIKYILLIWYALPNSTFTHSLSHIFKWISMEKKPTIAKKKKNENNAQKKSHAQTMMVDVKIYVRACVNCVCVCACIRERFTVNVYKLRRTTLLMEKLLKFNIYGNDNNNNSNNSYHYYNSSTMDSAFFFILVLFAIYGYSNRKSRKY